MCSEEEATFVGASGLQKTKHVRTDVSFFYGNCVMIVNEGTT